DQVTLTIADNGRGFDANTSHKGVGLDSMRERAEALGGNLQVANVNGGGTHVVAMVPIGGEGVKG
ncbi:MAG TPA: ATP-binding protein, partial [Roseiflexaceae bacterium]|nr:ATP-binding protein [Roseiflexaceae bacterium]